MVIDSEDLCDLREHGDYFMWKNIRESLFATWYPAMTYVQ